MFEDSNLDVSNDVRRGVHDYSASLAAILGGHEPLPRSLSRRAEVRYSNTSRSRFWREKDDVIYLLTWSDGTSGKVWIHRLKQGGHEVIPAAQQLMQGTGFKPTFDMVRMIAILKGKHIVGRHTVHEVHQAFRRHPLAAPHPEVACLLRTHMSERHIVAMGMSHIVVAHAPILGHNSRLVLGVENLYVCAAHDPVDLGQQAPGVAFVVWEHVDPHSIAA